MNISKEYQTLKECVLKRIPDTFSINNNVIEEQDYDATFLPANYNPYRMNGQYYPTFFEFTPRTFVGEPPSYRMSKGEETTINIWSAILRYQEYDLLADLFILAFLHDCLEEEIKYMRDKPRSIAGALYSFSDMRLLCEEARSALEKNDYGTHNRRCKRYLSVYISDKIYLNYERMAWEDSLEISCADELAQIMMEAIIDAYSSKYFIIKRPSEKSIDRAASAYSKAVNEWQEELFSQIRSMDSSEEN